MEPLRSPTTRPSPVNPNSKRLSRWAAFSTSPSASHQVFTDFEDDSHSQLRPDTCELQAARTNACKAVPPNSACASDGHIELLREAESLGVPVSHSECWRRGKALSLLQDSGGNILGHSRATLQGHRRRGDALIRWERKLLRKLSSTEAPGVVCLDGIRRACGPGEDERIDVRRCLQQRKVLHRMDGPGA